MQRVNLPSQKPSNPPGGGTLIYSRYVGLDPVSTVYPTKNIRNIRQTPQKIEILVTPQKNPIMYIHLKKRPFKCIEMIPKNSSVLQ